MKRLFGNAVGLVVAAGLSACGTTYQLPEVAEVQSQDAARMFAEARAEAPRKSLSTSAAERRFQRVATRIGATGKQYCETLTADQKGFNCNVDIGIDREMTVRNAYFTYEDGAPKIRISMPLLKDTSSDDEVAFVLGHEYGHLVGRHSEKKQQQAAAGALLLGVLAVAAGADAGYYDPGLVESSVALGAAAGSVAYSQSYELESDTLGTRITHAAGYDPVAGAKYFARPEPARTEAGRLSFWGTHPPDEKRVATVLATIDLIEAQIGLTKIQ